jgi:hypothetical protein
MRFSTLLALTLAGALTVLVPFGSAQPIVVDAPRDADGDGLPEAGASASYGPFCRCLCPYAGVIVEAHAAGSRASGYGAVVVPIPLCGGEAGASLDPGRPDASKGAGASARPYDEGFPVLA